MPFFTVFCRFLLPHCNKKFPKDINRNSRPCLNYHLKLCAGACNGKVSASDNNQSVHNALQMILSGKSDTVNKLREEMNVASENLDFEKAAKLSDKEHKEKEKWYIIYNKKN